MKEKEFIKKLREIYPKEEFEIKAYYTINEKGNVVIDEESMEDEFKWKLQEVKDILE